MEHGQIVTWDQLSKEEQERVLPLFRQVFFLTSSRKSFSSDEEREKFWSSWTGYFFRNEPQHIYLALADDGQLCGYLTGCADSENAFPKIVGDIASFACFKDQFADFPAHLHVNCHPSHQGKGWGRRLVEAFVGDMAKTGVRGVHLVTSPEEENVHFYRRLNFSHQVGRHWKNYPLLFLGRRL
ncbi:MAG: GNAT family N-acetyltransferase [Bdellovibrionaceae bacterium]|nr:GNAT family N-acetyltransferase [Bdellovibrionales bacterium]MCB9086244.1 GNAT family N-acetyltransferase [Pseudobdellovibrionaceae bacterium]